MKAFIYFSLLVLILSACSNDEITVSGKVKNYFGRYFTVEKRIGPFYQPIDTIFTKPDSTFKFSLKKNDPDVYRLNFNPRNRLSILVGNADFFIEVDAGRINGKYKVTGSPDHDLVEDIRAVYGGFDSLETVVKIKEQYRQAVQKTDEKAMKELKLKFEQALKKKDRMIKDIILEGLDNGAYVGVVEMMNRSVLNPVAHLEFYEIVSDRLNREIPEAAITKSFQNTVQQMEQNFNDQ